MSKKVGSRISITITSAQRARLEKLTEETGISAAAHIRRALDASFLTHPALTLTAQEIVDRVNADPSFVKC
jgi:hypothetical protein